MENFLKKQKGPETSQQLFSDCQTVFDALIQRCFRAFPKITIVIIIPFS